MPYCPACGVEVEAHVKNCPLCRQDIPLVLDPATMVIDDRFPVPVNIYGKQWRRIKNQILFSVTLLLVSALFCLGFLHFFLGMKSMSFHYSAIGIVCAWFYALLILGYLSNVYHSVTAAGVVTTALVCGIDGVDGKMAWAPGLAVPLVVLGVLVLSAVIRVYRRFKHKNQYVVIPIYICIVGALVCPAVEVLIDYRLSGAFELSWSVLVSIPLVTVACVLLGLYLKLPERMREKIRKKLHI